MHLWVTIRYPCISRRRNISLSSLTRGLFCYGVMLFGLKNVGATYQRLVNMIFKPLIGQTMEVYVDDIITKSKNPKELVKHL